MKINFLLDNPYKFFRKAKPRAAETVSYALGISAIFAVLNEISIFSGLTPEKLIYSHFNTALIIFSSLVTGFLIVAALFSLLAYGNLNKKSYLMALFVLVYSATPFMLFGWIPHAAVKVAVLVWSSAFIIIGIRIKMGKTYRRALAIMFCLVILLIAISLLSHNFVLAPV